VYSDWCNAITFNSQKWIVSGGNIIFCTITLCNHRPPPPIWRRNRIDVVQTRHFYPIFWSRCINYKITSNQYISIDVLFYLNYCKHCTGFIHVNFLSVNNNVLSISYRYYYFTIIYMNRMHLLKFFFLTAFQNYTTDRHGHGIPSVQIIKVSAPTDCLTFDHRRASTCQHQ